MENKDAYEKAKKRVESRIGFFIHLIVYLLVNVVLISINLRTSPQHLWFVWPLAGWGVGICFHALSVFLSFDASAFKERMIEKEMARGPDKKT